ncbi:hypothetical protein Tco_1212964 [Tanacetum coccineum]
MSLTPLSCHLIVVFQREMLEEEYWGSLLRAAYFEIRLEDKEKLEWFRSMVVESQFRVCRKRWFITMVPNESTWVSMLGVYVLAKLLVTSVGVVVFQVDICVVLLPMSVGVVVCGSIAADVVVVESLSSGMSAKTERWELICVFVFKSISYFAAVGDNFMGLWTNTGKQDGCHSIIDDCFEAVAANKVNSSQGRITPISLQLVYKDDEYNYNYYMMYKNQRCDLDNAMEK